MFHHWWMMAVMIDELKLTLMLNSRNESSLSVNLNFNFTKGTRSGHWYRLSIFELLLGSIFWCNASRRPIQTFHAQDSRHLFSVFCFFFLYCTELNCIYLMKFSRCHCGDNSGQWQCQFQFPWSRDPTESLQTVKSNFSFEVHQCPFHRHFNSIHSASQSFSFGSVFIAICRQCASSNCGMRSVPPKMKAWLNLWTFRKRWRAWRKARLRARSGFSSCI